MKNTVLIRNNETNVTAVYKPENEIDDDDDFLWSEGNYSCDCNRAIFFNQVIHPLKDIEFNSTCSEGKFSVTVYDKNGKIIHKD